MRNLASYIDHTILKADATLSEVAKVCREAIGYGFASVCVNPYYVGYAVRQLGGKVKVTSVVGFPLGANRKEVKALEAKLAIEDGATELDMVINIGALKDRDYSLVRDDILEVLSVCEKNTVLKVIIETSLLDRDEKMKICEICRDCGVDFVKTSTGFSSGGATVDDISLMKNIVGEKVEVKASGGIRTYEKAIQMIESGATRIGASSSVDIIENKIKSEEESKY